MALNTKVIIAGVSVVVVIAILAAVVLPNMTGGAGGGENVYYVVAHYWNFAIYDENFNRVDQIKVKLGDKVKLYFFNARAFAPEFYEPLEEETIQAGVGGLSGDDLRAKIEEAVKGGLIDHGLQITEFKVFMSTNVKNFSGKAKNLQEFLQIENKEAIEQQSIVFTADKAGTFNIVCYIVCGYGHSFMMLENAIVVEA